VELEAWVVPGSPAEWAAQEALANPAELEAWVVPVIPVELVVSEG
jgi:hypothetical protein